MTEYDDLRQLQQQCAEKKRLEARRRELQAQCETLRASAQELEAVLRCEQEDVARLEGRSLAAMFYQMTGSIDERLSRERQEACAAALKHDAAVKALADAEEELRRCEHTLVSFAGCEERYAAALREKAAAVKAAGGEDGAKLLQLDERLAALESRAQELREALSAGEAALASADRVLASLSHAEGWGTWDVLGGGLISDLAKHSHLDAAQAELEQLQRQLRRFKTELADVTVQADLQVNVDGFLRFADYFFDGIFADWAVMDRISRAEGQVYDTRGRIEGVMARLDAMLAQAEQERIRTEAAREELIRRAGAAV